MTQATFVSSPFHDISLSLADKKQLQGVAHTILDVNLDRYQRFYGVDGGKVSTSEWKLVKCKGQVQVYHQRQNKASPNMIPVSPKVDSSVLHSTMCVGSITGRLEDIMQGLADQTRGTDDFARAAVLAKVKTPTPTKPFRSITVKWAELDVRLKSMGLVKNHDYVYVEASGVRRLRSGARVGYHLMHSVGFSEAQVLSDRVRGQLSVCSFFRQTSETSVSIYVMGMMDSPSERTQRVIVPYFVKTLLSLFRPSQYENTRSSMTEAPSKHLARLKKLERIASGDTCTTCRKRQWKILLHHDVCNVCSVKVCSSCKVVRKLNFVTLDLQIAQRDAIFCTSCADDAETYGFAKKEKAAGLHVVLRTVRARSVI